MSSLIPHDYRYKISSPTPVDKEPLFHELERWALAHPDLEFMSFNEKVLTFSEGFQFSHLDRKEPFVILHDS